MVLAGTICTIILAGVREQFSNARISENEAKTAQAIAESDVARKGAAEANARALEAQLALEEFKAPRNLTDEQTQEVADMVRPFTSQVFQVLTYWEMKEPLALTNQIYAALNIAGWKYLKPKSAEFMLGGTEGVQVWRHPRADESVQKAADSLVKALNAAGIVTALKLENPANPMNNTININVGTKP